MYSHRKEKFQETNAGPMDLAGLRLVPDIGAVRKTSMATSKPTTIPVYFVNFCAWRK
jgi:hypothetical protein